MDPVARDYVVENGRPVEDVSLLTPAYFRLRTKRKTWMYAPDDRYGSDYHLIKKNLTASNNGRLAGVGERALQPLLDDGRADEIQVDLTQQSRHGAGIEFKITDAEGETEQFTFNPVGG
jgi:phage gp46-like protein